MSKHDDDDYNFSSEGTEPYPNLYLDKQRLLGIGALVVRDTGIEYLYPIEYLETVVGQYTHFLADPDILPSHRERANRNLDGYIFELAFRDGVYDDTLENIMEESNEQS